MRIIGIDPGIGRVGWGVIDYQKGGFSVVAFGCIETQPKSELPGRLEAIFSEVNAIINEYNPQEMAVEELFFNTNTTTAMMVGQGRGVILLAGSHANLAIASYTPLQIKMALTGYGRAEKSQMGQMVKVILKLQTIPKPDDTNDALAVAITHAFSRKAFL